MFPLQVAAATRHVREIVDPWQALVDDELEGDGRQKQNERRLESILSQTLLYAERQTRQTADRRLQTPQALAEMF